MKDFKAHVRDSGAAITGNFRKTPGITYFPGHLGSILQNLLSNALNFQDPNRKLRIAVRSKVAKDFIAIKVHIWRPR